MAYLLRWFTGSGISLGFETNNFACFAEVDVDDSHADPEQLSVMIFSMVALTIILINFSKARS